MPGDGGGAHGKAKTVGARLLEVIEIWPFMSTDFDIFFRLF